MSRPPLREMLATGASIATAAVAILICTGLTIVALAFPLTPTQNAEQTRQVEVVAQYVVHLYAIMDSCGQLDEKQFQKDVDRIAQFTGTSVTYWRVGHIVTARAVAEKVDEYQSQRLENTAEEDLDQFTTKDESGRADTCRMIAQATQ